MRPDELEPMSAALRDLLEAEKPLEAVPAALRAKLLTKVAASMVAATAAGTAVATGSAAALGGKAAVASSGATAGSVATSTGATAAATSTAAAGTAVATTTALTTKVLIAAVAFSVGGGVGVGVHSAVAPRHVEVPAPIVLRVTPPAAPAPVPQEHLNADPPPPAVAEREPSVKPTPPTKPHVAPKPAAPQGNLDAERSLVEQARAALSRHEPHVALRALNQHEREYPDGQLAEERTALQVLALSESRANDEARALAQRFRARYPQSLLMPAVDAAVPR